MDWVKATLKAARDSIKIKDYAQALQLSKAVLKEDKTNYMGLIFLGISLQEIGPVDQAPKAFRKAIGINATNILAWNGLLNYYEKIDNFESKLELMSIYATILDIESNENKLLEICMKIINLSLKDDIKIIQTIFKVYKNDKITNDTKNATANIIFNYLSDKNIPEECNEMYEEILLFLITNPELISENMYAEYLKYLHKQNNYDLLLIEAEKMHELFKSNAIPVEWICTIYNELKVEENQLVDKYDEKIMAFCDLLLNLDFNSSIGLFTKALLLFYKKEFLDSIDLLHKVLNVKPGLLHAWILLANCFISLQIHSDAIEAILKANKLLETIDKPNSNLRSLVDLIMCNCLSKSNDNNQLLQSIEISQNILKDDKENVSIISILIETYINLENNIQAKVWLSKLKEITNTSDLHAYLFALLFKKQNKFKDALELLEKNPQNTYEYWLLLGETYWDCGDFGQSLIPFLKAAKLNINSYICFLNLGIYYQKMGDNDKAQRCFEKSFKMNIKCVQAGSELSKIYRKQKNWDTNLNLLLSLTGVTITASNLWAYLQLGLHYLEQEDYQNAINSLRVVIRSDPDNGHCWESLADAYFARGAYTAALKSFQRANELMPEALYPMLQIANIKKILGEFVEAREEFEQVLLINNTYVLALKGIAETCLYQASQFHRQQLHGLARDAAQYALQKITIALRESSDISCLWKIAADSCYLVATLPERNSCLLVAAALVEGKDENRNVILEQDELYKLSARCYCKSINISNENMLLYHDLATCYLSHAKSANCADELKPELLLRALASVQHCVKNNPQHWQHWNLLGNIAFEKEPKQLALAQHAFIKAIQTERNCAVGWSNLATLYLHLGQVRLANEAYSQAQRAEPNLINSWVGQALIAEAAGHEDAMDLFRHTTQLGANDQGAIGYANWVCRAILEAPEANANLYAINNMHAIPVALDALTWYTENNPDDPCAWNMLGLLRERMGLKTSASQAFRTALLHSNKNTRDYININYARSLFAVGKYEKSVQVFRDIKATTVKSDVGLALALFKDEQYQEAYEAYEAALQWNDSQSDLLVALASMAYLFQGAAEAKTLLFQSTGLTPRSSWGLYATLALGLLHDDVRLVNLVLKELKTLCDDLKCLPHYAILLTYTYLMQGENKMAVRELSKLIHRHPDQASLWLSLSILLLRLHKDRPVSSAAAKCAQKAMNLGQNNMDVTKVFCTVALASHLIGDYKSALKSAQRSIHCYPDVAEGWAMLITVLSALEHPSKSHICKKVILIKDNLKMTKPLQEWLNNNTF